MHVSTDKALAAGNVSLIPNEEKEFHVVKRYFSEGEHSSYSIVCIKDGEGAKEEAANIAKRLNRSTSDGSEWYVADMHSNSLQNIGKGHSDEALSEINIRLEAHEVFLSTLHEHDDIFEADESVLELVIRHFAPCKLCCPSMTKDRIQAILLDELKAGVKLSLSPELQQLYFKNPDHYNGLATASGFIIVDDVSQPATLSH